MFWIKATTRLICDWRRPDELVREVESELRLHIEMRTRANVEQGMTLHDAQRAAVQSFGDFERFRNDCCEIRRSLPFDSTPLRMALHITVAIMAGLAALWAVNVPHHNFTGVMRQLIAIAVLSYLFFVVRRTRSKQHMPDEPAEKITGYDEQGRTPVERVFKS
jgi:hypothetical protein